MYILKIFLFRVSDQTSYFMASAIWSNLPAIKIKMYFYFYHQKVCDTKEQKIFKIYILSTFIIVKVLQFHQLPYITLFICLKTFSFACSIVHCIVAPAARICPPPPSKRHTSDTLTYSFDLIETLQPLSV